VPKLVNDLASSSASMGGCLRVQIQATKLWEEWVGFVGGNKFRNQMIEEWV
jgi:hypothetical protein